MGKAALIAIAVAVCADPAFAQGTEQEREACTPDAMRLCGQYIPDADRITDCLRNSGPRLSPACYAVFYPPRVVTQTPPRAGAQPPRRMPPPPPPEDDDDD
ncbi:hypothetical protein [Afipia clevelandensis]|uniref:Cysteine rich repeat protein n=1 Tax=Afipia clevelandensis ATCC 49720 TaxID=883079 RepID=K8PGV4_9BRAD|nr:hypothetical protein [Afipia clevelandensis]EKS37603.1 hypothetical protein HMPREF9696_01553 [Afipia clevelandensis ATCC 49720]